MEIPPPEAGWDVWGAAMAFLGHKFRQAHKNQIKRTFSLHAVMDGEESLQFEFDGSSERRAALELHAAAERARLQHFYCLKERSVFVPPHSWEKLARCARVKSFSLQRTSESSRGDGH